MGKKIFNIQFYKDPAGIPPKYMSCSLEHIWKDIWKQS